MTEPSDTPTGIRGTIAPLGRRLLARRVSLRRSTGVSLARGLRERHRPPLLESATRLARQRTAGAHGKEAAPQSQVPAGLEGWSDFALSWLFGSGPPKSGAQLSRASASLAQTQYKRPAFYDDLDREREDVATAAQAEADRRRQPVARGRVDEGASYKLGRLPAEPRAVAEEPAAAEEPAGAAPEVQTEPAAAPDLGLEPVEAPVEIFGPARDLPAASDRPAAMKLSRKPAAERPGRASGPVEGVRGKREVPAAEAPAVEAPAEPATPVAPREDVPRASLVLRKPVEAPAAPARAGVQIARRPTPPPVPVPVPAAAPEAPRRGLFRRVAEAVRRVAAPDAPSGAASPAPLQAREAEAPAPAPADPQPARLLRLPARMPAARTPEIQRSAAPGAATPEAGPSAEAAEPPQAEPEPPQAAEPASSAAPAYLEAGPDETGGVEATPDSPTTVELQSDPEAASDTPAGRPIARLLRRAAAAIQRRPVDSPTFPPSRAAASPARPARSSPGAPAAASPATPPAVHVEVPRASSSPLRPLLRAASRLVGGGGGSGPSSEAAFPSPGSAPQQATLARAPLAGASAEPVEAAGEPRFADAAAPAPMSLLSRILGRTPSARPASAAAAGSPAAAASDNGGDARPAMRLLRGGARTPSVSRAPAPAARRSDLYQQAAAAGATVTRDESGQTTVSFGSSGEATLARQETGVSASASASPTPSAGTRLAAVPPAGPAPEGAQELDYDEIYEQVMTRYRRELIGTKEQMGENIGDVWRP